jgi:hypothetical protein
VSEEQEEEKGNRKEKIEARTWSWLRTSRRRRIWRYTSLQRKVYLLLILLRSLKINLLLPWLTILE